MIQTNLGFSNFTFLDRYGNDLFMLLNSFSFDNSANTIAFVTGYTTSYSSAATFEFVSGNNKVYVFIPFTTNAPTNANLDVVDLTAASAPPNNLANWNGNGVLSPFNFFDMTDYNQWYSTVIGTSTVLISNFIYRITNDNNAATTQAAPASTLTALAWTTAITAATGDKLCYASISNGNVLIC